MSENQNSNAADTAKPPQKFGWPQSVPPPPRSGSSCSTSLIVTIVWPCMPNGGKALPIDRHSHCYKGEHQGTAPNSAYCQTLSI